MLTEQQKGVDYDMFIAAKNYIQNFINEDPEKFQAGILKSTQIDEDFCNDFREFLLTRTPK